MSNKRKETLVELALVKFVDGVDASHRCDILEYDLVGTDTHNWAVFLKKSVIDLALLEAENVRSYPEIGHRRVPGTGYRTQGRQEELVYHARDSVEYDEGDEDEDDVMGYPRQGVGGERSCRFHSDEMTGMENPIQERKEGQGRLRRCRGWVGGRPGEEGGSRW